MLPQIAAIAVTLLALDAVWLTLRAGAHDALFRAVQGGVPLRIRMLPAALVYAIMTLLVFIYAARDASSAIDAARRGALIGFLAYAFYDLTNYATLSGYTLEMTILDIGWGTLLFTAAAVAGYRVGKFLGS
jgi:uncharacterized membrane protein